MKDNGGPAFPCLGNVAHNSDWTSDDGMSLRDWFAGMVLGGQWEGRFPVDMREPTNVEKVVATCYELADAMIAERDKP